MVRICLALWETARSVFQSGCIYFAFHQQRMRVPCSTFSPAFGGAGILDFHHSNSSTVVSHCCFNWLCFTYNWEWAVVSKVRQVNPTVWTRQPIEMHKEKLATTTFIYSLHYNFNFILYVYSFVLDVFWVLPHILMLKVKLFFACK